MSTKDGFPRWVVDACSTPDIVGITAFADFWFLIRGFFGTIAFILWFDSKIYIWASCCYIAKCYIGELLLRQVVTWRVVTWRVVT